MCTNLVIYGHSNREPTNLLNDLPDEIRCKKNVYLFIADCTKLINIYKLVVPKLNPEAAFLKVSTVYDLHE